MTGRVVKSTGSWYTVENDLGKRTECRIKGKFRMKELRTTNPVAVGDIVDFQPEPDQQTAIITHLHAFSKYSINQVPSAPITP